MKVLSPSRNFAYRRDTDAEGARWSPLDQRMKALVAHYIIRLRMAFELRIYYQIPNRVITYGNMPI